MIVVDASVWVSIFLRADAFYAASRDWLHRSLSVDTPLVTPTLLPVEVAGAVARRTGNIALGQAAHTNLLRTRTLRLVNVDAVLAQTAADLAARLQLRGADAVYAAVALRLSAPLITWDQELLDRAGTVVQTQQP